jgi:uncharacterized membrane protein
VRLTESFYRRIASEAEELNMRPILDIVTTISIGLLIGTEFAVAVFINPILRKLGPREELHAIRLFAAMLGAAMPLWYTGSLLLLIAVSVVGYHEPGENLLLAASVIWASVIVLTILFLVPINNRLARMDSNLSPESALAEHGKWDLLQRWRVVSLTGAMVCFLVATRLAQ